jgi:hypothetical protein
MGMQKASTTMPYYHTAVYAAGLLILATLAVFIFYTYTNAATTVSKNTPQKSYTLAEVTKMAADTFPTGSVPLGDKKYTTTGPKKGYIYLCNVPRQDDGGAQAVGPWIDAENATWNFKKKLSVSGDVSWSNAAFTATISGTQRILTGNGLPISHTTGTFPVPRTDAVYAYDRNPNSIAVQTLRESIPTNPVYNSTPNCMGMEVGVMATGVPLFNGFDAGLRDAPAHEAQDHCDGHPQMNGQYHYHNLSSCLRSKKVTDVVGYALDGFPITGPYVDNKKYLTTDDLDVCHGITSPIYEKGKLVTKYHYVLTHDFPYSVSCFRGTPSRTGPVGTQGRGQPIGRPTTAQQPSNTSTPTIGTPYSQDTPPTPPQEALTACSGKFRGTSCSFTTPRGTITGTCDAPPGVTWLGCKSSTAL